MSLRVGAVRASYAGGAPVTAASIAPRLDWSLSRTRGSLEAGFAQLTTGNWTAQFAGDAATTRPLGDYALGAAASAVASYLDGSVWSGTSVAGLAVGRRVGGFTATGGGSLGVVRSISDTTHLLAAAHVSLSTRFEGAATSLRLQRAGAGPLHWTDMDLKAARPFGAVTLEAAIGLRSFDSLGTDAAWHIQAAVGLHRAFVLEASVGAYPRSADGFSEGRFAALGVRILTLPGGPPPPTVERIGDRTRVRFAVPGATRVEIAGDWNGWTPAPMTRDGDGRWSAELPFEGGAHKFVIVIDGERPTVPHGMPTLPDGFGGTVGLLVAS